MTATATPTKRQELLGFILTTAAEGGMNYWANDPAEDGTLQVERVDHYEPEEGAEDSIGWVEAIVFNKRAVEDVSGAKVLPHLPGVVTPDGPLVIVGYAQLSKALRAIVEGKVTWGGQPLGPNSRLKALAAQLLFAKGNDDAPDYDAGDADALVQAALFGDVIYG
jgi:hypothetical protein